MRPFLDVVDAAVLVAAAIGRTAVALELRGSVDAIRRHAEVQRGDPEQAELDAVLAGVTEPSGGVAAETDRSRIADQIAGIAGR